MWTTNQLPGPVERRLDRRLDDLLVEDLLLAQHLGQLGIEVSVARRDLCVDGGIVRLGLGRRVSGGGLLRDVGSSADRLVRDRLLRDRLPATGSSATGSVRDRLVRRGVLSDRLVRDGLVRDGFVSGGLVGVVVSGGEVVSHGAHRSNSLRRRSPKP